MIVKPSVVLSALMLLPLPLLATGEEMNGFPKWEERVIQEWSNRARSDPQYEMTQCGAPCTEHACYAPIAPFSYSLAANHSSRFHADYMRLGGAFTHDTNCILRTDINSVYPQICNGAPNCACTGSGSTLWSTRLSYFGATAVAENIAEGSPGYDPDALFYFLLYEPGSGTTCADTGPNGHRWNILHTPGGSLGSGWSANTSLNFLVMDMAMGSTPTKIVSGVHYPQQAASVDFWANWYDTAGPLSANVFVDGTRYPLTRARGIDTNGAWTTTVTGVGSGCHRYYFAFTDSASALQLYPSTGTFGIGDPTTCPDYAAPLTITTPESVAPGATGVVASVPNQAGSTFTWTLTGGTITAGQNTSTIQYGAASPGTRMILSVIRTGPAGAPSAAGVTRVMVDFLDVPPSHVFHSFVIKLARNGITAGCGGGNYCPDAAVTRAQIAVFLLAAKHGTSFVPPPATGTVFADVPANSFAAAWIEELYAEGITGGCATNPLRYCPNASLTRAQMSVFLLVGEHGPSYTPPPATGTVFVDVPASAFAAAWIEQLYHEGITGGCGTNPPRFCPDGTTSRGQMAVFLVATFALP